MRCIFDHLCVSIVSKSGSEYKEHVYRAFGPFNKYVTRGVGGLSESVTKFDKGVRWSIQSLLSHPLKKVSLSVGEKSLARGRWQKF